MKNITAEKLRKNYEKKLSELQKNCTHKKSKWMEYQWAPGHSYGEVLVCERCDKILDRKNDFEVYDDPLYFEIDE